MKIKHLATIATASIISLGFIGFTPNIIGVSSPRSNVANAAPCAGNPCAGNPCAGNPCAGNPCAGGSSWKNPCAGNPCAGNPCAGDPCASNPCAGKWKTPCAGNPCAGNPCAGNPCAGNPCAGNPCAGNPCAGKSASAPNVYIESSSQLAIRGTDPVAYFRKGKAVKGRSKYEYEWNGATWRFSKRRNMALFAANPQKYAPQYGGYCAKAMSEGNVVSTDPKAWKIVEGKLYLNYSKEVQQEWVQDIPGNVALADGFYPKALVGATVFE